MKSQGEAINHFNGVRLRVVGEGDLQVNVFALDDSNPTIVVAPVETLIPYPMVTITQREPTLLMNVRQQRMSIEFKVTEINEWFEIGRVIVFTRPLFSSFPGRG